MVRQCAHAKQIWLARHQIAVQNVWLALNVNYDMPASIKNAAIHALEHVDKIQVSLTILLVFWRKVQVFNSHFCCVSY